MEFRDFDNFSVDLFLQKGSTNTSCCVGPRRKLIKYLRHVKRKKNRRVLVMPADHLINITSGA